MSRFVRILPVLALLAPGCAGSVKVDEIDGFGLVKDAVWLHLDDGDTESDSISISNVSGLCDKMTAYYEAYNDYVDAINDLDADSDCGDLEDPFNAIAEAAQEVSYEGVHVIDFAVHDDDDTEPQEDSYDVDKGLDMTVQGTVTYVTDDLWGSQLDDFDADGDLVDNCGMDAEVDITDYQDSYKFDDGSVEFTGVSDEDSAAGTIDVDLVTNDEDEDDSGTLQAKFSASYCSIDL